jgi:hypothetical protein
MGDPEAGGRGAAAEATAADRDQTATATASKASEEELMRAFVPYHKITAFAWSVICHIVPTVRPRASIACMLLRARAIHHSAPARVQSISMYSHAESADMSSSQMTDLVFMSIHRGLQRKALADNDVMRQGPGQSPRR